MKWIPRMDRVQDAGASGYIRLITAFLMIIAIFDPARSSSCVSAAEQSLADRDAARVETIARITPSVVCVMAADGQGGGSGVLISADGYAVTNYHVTSACGNFMKCGLSDGNVYDAVIVGIDPTGDLALIQLQGRNDFSAATPGDSSRVQVGDEVMALGNPFLLATDFTPTVTFGIVSGVHRYQYPADTFLEYTDCIQIDASINPGNSGGPLFDIQGNWIGINGRASFEKRGRVNSGAAYAITVRQVLLFLEHLRCGMIVDHGITDFTVQTSDDGQVDVAEVSEISEAWRRGLRPGHELLTFAGRPVASANDFQNILGIFPEGTRIPLSWRDIDQVRSATIRLRPLHGFRKAPEIPEKDGPKTPDAPQEIPIPGHTPPRVPPVSSELQALYQERDGFTNYRFNLQRQDSILNALTAVFKPTPNSRRTWIVGVTSEQAAEAAAPGELLIAEAASSLSISGKQWYQPAEKYDQVNEPPQLQGLLVTAQQWRNLFELGRPAFDEVTAAAQVTQPFVLTGAPPAASSVLITKKAEITCRWHFDFKNPLPAAVDVEYAQGVDECRLLFEQWNLSSSIPFPERIGWIDPQTENVTWLNVSGITVPEATEPKQTSRYFSKPGWNWLPARFDGRSRADVNPPSRPVYSQVQMKESHEFQYRLAVSEKPNEPVAKLIDERQRAVVKLFGAGVGNLDSYGSGVLISSEGHVLTVWNHLINVGVLTAVTHDGRKFGCSITGTDKEHDVAILKLNSAPDETFPFVDLAHATEADVGQSVLAFSNMFHVATGNEPVSVVHGIVAAKVPLSAEQGRWVFPLRAPVLIIDAVINNSGAAGGLLTLADGTPVGLIGRELRHRSSNTWVNYAVPLSLLAGTVESLKAGIRLESSSPETKYVQPLTDKQLTETFGITMLPNVVEQTPAYVDSVVADSAAARAGLRRGDLIVLLDSDAISSVVEFQKQLATRRPGQMVSLTVSRDQQLRVISFSVP